MSMEEHPKIIRLRENKKLKELLKKVNTAIRRLVPSDISLTDINCASFGAAWYIQDKMAPEHIVRRGRARARNTEPTWKLKIEKKINHLRAEISQITTFLESQNPTGNLQRKINNIKRRYNIGNDQLSGRKAENQATVKALAAEIRNKEKLSKSR